MDRLSRGVEGVRKSTRLLEGEALPSRKTQLEGEALPSRNGTLRRASTARREARPPIRWFGSPGGSPSRRFVDVANTLISVMGVKSSATPDAAVGLRDPQFQHLKPRVVLPGIIMYNAIQFVWGDAPGGEAAAGDPHAPVHL
ncbi:MAG: hypothetical protein QXI60_08885 [Thermofilaceae archaeon]